MDGTIFADEHTEFCVLGGAGHNGLAANTEYLVPSDGNGNFLHPDDGGVYPEPSRETVPKYPAQASGIFSCAAPTMVADGSFTRPDGTVLSWKAGEQVGRAGSPLRYKGVVVGVAAFRKHREAVFALARKASRGKGGNKSVWFKYNGDNPYKERCEDQSSSWYGDNWEDHMPSTFKYVCITELIDNVIEQGTAMFKGSTREQHDWKIYHDRLSQWWEAEAQEYIRSRGFADRQWRASKSTNDHIKAAGDKSNYYVDSLMGDTPEAMPLDSSLFNDLIEANGKIQRQP